jgi:hypothetical protein
LLAAPVAPALPAHSWLLDDDAASTTATAQFGGQDGTLNNGPTWSTDTPFSYTGNYSVSFDGSDDEIALGSNVVPHGASAWTDFSVSAWVSAWVKYTDVGSVYTILSDFINSSGNSGTKGNFFLESYNAGGAYKNEVFIWDGDNASPRYYGVSSGTIPIGAWTHVAMVSKNNGSEIYLYLDDIKEGTAAAGPITFGLGATGDTKIGKMADTWYPLGGLVDEVAIWDHALTDDNVEWLYQNSLSQIPIPEPTSVVLFSMGLLSLAMFRRRKE